MMMIGYIIVGTILGITALFALLKFFGQLGRARAGNAEVYARERAQDWNVPNPLRIFWNSEENRIRVDMLLALYVVAVFVMSAYFFYTGTKVLTATQLLQGLFAIWAIVTVQLVFLWIFVGASPEYKKEWRQAILMVPLTGVLLSAEAIVEYIMNLRPDPVPVTLTRAQVPIHFDDRGLKVILGDTNDWLCTSPNKVVGHYDITGGTGQRSTVVTFTAPRGESRDVVAFLAPTCPDKI